MAFWDKLFGKHPPPEAEKAAAPVPAPVAAVVEPPKKVYGTLPVEEMGEEHGGHGVRGGGPGGLLPGSPSAAH